MNILRVMPFNVGSLHVRYLGVPLISKRLYIKDCQMLIDKVKKRVLDWKNKVLSFASRHQLIQSVNYGEFKRGKAKVNWSVVCKPKAEGGLGSAGAGSILRRLRSAKSSGKARDRNEDSPGDNRGVLWLRVVAFRPYTGIGDVGNTACSPTSSKGGIASAKTGNVNDRDMAVLALKSRTRISSVYEYQDPTSRSQCRICNRLNRANGLVLGKPTAFSNSFIRNDFSKSTSVTKNNVSNDFSRPVTTQILPTLKKSCLKNTNVLATGMYKIHTAHTQARTSKLPQDSKRTNKSVSFSTGVIPTTSVCRPQLKSNPKGDRVLRSNSHGKKLEVEEHRRNVKLSKNKMPVTACTDNLNAKIVNVKSVSAMCVKCVMPDKHDVCVTKSVAKPIRKTVASESIKKPRNNVRKLHERFGKI
nr:hypothetical protein [Tanacetum cinerariifolium]